jgi:hypothetical protein
MQGTEDRGFVLRATEEIMVLLEDMGLNLQSMMASPFVRPFLSEVRGWEQKLSLIGELLDIPPLNIVIVQFSVKELQAKDVHMALCFFMMSNWVFCLSLAAGECIEVWMLVQRKWMYLESIFVGSDDIRHQLPQVGEGSKRHVLTACGWCRLGRLISSNYGTDRQDTLLFTGLLHQLQQSRSVNVLAWQPWAGFCVFPG